MLYPFCNFVRIETSLHILNCWYSLIAYIMLKEKDSSGKQSTAVVESILISNIDCNEVSERKFRNTREKVEYDLQQFTKRDC